MLERLPASHTAPRSRPATAVLSVLVHLAVIAAAVHASGWSAPPAVPTHEPLTLIYHAPPPEPLRSRVARPYRPGSSVPRESIAPSLERPIDIQLEVPPGLTSQGLRSLLTPPAPEFSGHGANGGLDHVTDWYAGRVYGSGEPLDDVTVERVAQPISARVPRYPDALRVARIEGDVLVRFVVDTLGRIEPGSLRIMASTQAAFVREVEEALALTRFRPAEVHGHLVRQLVEQRFQFRLTSR